VSSAANNQKRGDYKKDLSPKAEDIPYDLRFTKFVTTVDRIR